MILDGLDQEGIDTTMVEIVPDGISPHSEIMVNPQNVQEITEKMLLLEKDEALYQKQKEIGIIRAQQFSWKYTAEQLLTVYEDVYRQRD